MKKAFLSHSSKDKSYIDIVAKKIGIDNCVYDKHAFEEGMETIDEIYKGLDETDVFVLFISDTSLNSPWVRKEMGRAKSLWNSNSIQRFYPIIIDSKIKYNDERIPQWMQKHFIIKYIASPTIAANRIRSRMREIAWGANPKLKQRNQFFIGRNEEVARFEERRSDFDRPDLKCINASSAFVGIGRKAYMSHVLKKDNMMGETHDYNLITLEKHESIEDLILKISDLSTGKADPSQIANMSMDDKIAFAVMLIKEMQSHNEFIFINDEGVIVRPNSEMSDWFETILKLIDSKLVICIASIYNLHMRKSLETVFACQIQELSKNERGLMLKECCTLEGIGVSNEDLKVISSNLSGYPGQVFYAVQMIKDDGVRATMNQLHELKEYADSRSQTVLDRYANSEGEQDFLVFLASFDFVGCEILDKVYEKHPEYKKMMEQFISVSICEYIGAEGEYVRVNDVLKDIIFRRRMSMGKELEELFEELADCTVNDDFIHSTDLSQYYNVVRNKLVKGNFDEKYIIPSHYIKSIVKHYNSRQYEKASNLCKKIIDGDRINNFDSEIVYEIYYYYCQSLAREHNKDQFFNAIGYDKFKEDDRAFLLGFYHRINGEPEKAIENLSRALSIRKNFPKAKRELANAYLASEDYESAERLCVDNYNDDKTNPYYIQPYFESLIHRLVTGSSMADVDNKSKKGLFATEGREDIISLMKYMLTTMEHIELPQAKQMYVSMKAEFCAVIENDFKKAMDVIDKGLAQASDTSIYLYLTKFDIAYRNNDVEIMAAAIEAIESIVKNQTYFLNALNLRRARYYSVLDDKRNAILMLEKVKDMPKHAMEKFREEIG